MQTWYKRLVGNLIYYKAMFKKFQKNTRSDIKIQKYSSIQVFKYENIKCMQSFKFAILEFDYLLSNNVKARDPVGSN